MPPSCWNFYAGDTLSKTWMFYDKTNTLINLAGCTASFGIANQNGTSVFRCATTDAEPYLNITGSGTITLSVPSNITDDFSLGTMNTAIKINFADDTSFTYDAEFLSVFGDITSV